MDATSVAIWLAITLGLLLSVVVLSRMCLDKIDTSSFFLGVVMPVLLVLSGIVAIVNVTIVNVREYGIAGLLPTAMLLVAVAAILTRQVRSKRHVERIREAEEREQPFSLVRLERDHRMQLWHPDLPDTDNEAELIAVLRQHGFVAAWVKGEPLTEDRANQNYWFKLSIWKPSPPDFNPAWRLAAKIDTEEGPAALFVCPTEEHQYLQPLTRNDTSGDNDGRVEDAHQAYGRYMECCDIQLAIAQGEFTSIDDVATHVSERAVTCLVIADKVLGPGRTRNNLARSVEAMFLSARSAREGEGKA